jgi:hypothetical protein
MGPHGRLGAMITLVTAILGALVAGLRPQGEIGA